MLGKASGREAKRAVYAAALASGELAVENRYGRSEAAGVYVAHLAGTGWELDDNEQEILDEHNEYQEAGADD